MPIIKLFDSQKEITRSDVENALGIGSTSAIKTLKEMQNKDLIVKVGDGRLTRYIMK